MKKLMFVCMTIVLFMLSYVAAGESQVTFVGNGQQLNNFVGRGVALADLDGDGSLDIFLACIGPDEIWLNDGRSDFRDSKLRLGTEWIWEVAVGDVNKDGLPDLFVVNLSIDRSAVPENMMKGRFAEVWLNTSSKKRT